MNGWKIFGIAVVVIAIIAGSFLLKVALSDPIGRGNQIVEENSVNNRTGAQAFFEDTFETVKAQDSKIVNAQVELEAYQATVRPEGIAGNQYDERLRQLQQNVTGIKSVCLDAVADYNAEARKTIRSKWRSRDLPYQIDNTDPATDCA